MPHRTATAAHRFVALLRGVNVGRGNRLAMADWAALMRGLGLGEVRSLLNSGNAVFSSPVADAAAHAAALRSALQQQLGLDVPVLVKPAAVWAAVVAANVLAVPDVNPSQLLVVLAPDPATLAGLQALRTWLAAQGRSLSDRRWRQWLGLMRCAAASEGRAELDALDLWLAPYVAAATPDDVAPLAHWVQADWLGAVAHDAPWLQRAVQAFEQQLQIEQSARDDADADNAAGKLALARAIGMGAGPGGDGSAGDAGGDGMLRLVSQQLEDQLKRRYSPVHIAARLNQLAELQQQVQTAHDHTTAQARQLAQALTGRLWLPPELAASWQAAHDHTLAVLQALLQRLQLAQQGFAALPVDAQQDRGGP
ncbi:MAG: hypothetical protein CFE45_11425, partial [Burkholderiales bacterium PBB5]